MKIQDQIKEAIEDFKSYIIIGIGLVLVMLGIVTIPAVYRHVVEKDFIVALDIDGLAMKQYGWFQTEFFPLKLDSGTWQWQSHDGSWHYLNLPYDHADMIHPEAEHIVLVHDGAYLKSGNTHYPMKFVDGRGWYYYQDGEWLSLDDRWSP